MTMSQKGGIVYALVAKSPSVVFAETSSSVKELPGVAKRVLETIDFSLETKKSYSYQGFTYNSMVASGVCYLAVSDDKFQRRISFAFLTRIQDEYNKNHSKKGNASEYKKFMESEKNFFSTNPEADKLGALQNQVDEVKNIMLENIDKTLQRGAKLEDIDKKAEDLNVTTTNFHQKSKKLKCALLKKNIKLTIAIVICCIIIILLIALPLYFKFK
eukprot:TRINITY_DN1580_c0_g1_i1.p1 TRINITY_DN1580_c0_g1~~TRINITY_DN1580_c0_g1_i1.p1  ORF type:complete len:215 (-),score=55.12 TRINITY_DN1580_c0_g1_i1:223-867(-)